MKLISRQHLYLLVISLVLSVFVLLFSFGVLIPAGKKYRQQREIVQKDSYELAQYQILKDQTSDQAVKLAKKQAAILRSLHNHFDTKDFIEKNSQYFDDLKLTKVLHGPKEKLFDTYEINATSNIRTPKTFYKFLNNIDKEGWIIKVEFPVRFRREGELIHLLFTMQVYHVQ
jgi:hypothetical protein